MNFEFPVVLLKITHILKIRNVITVDWYNIFQIFFQFGNRHVLLSEFGDVIFPPKIKKN